MKLKNILFGLIIACTFASCSSEGDMIDEITNGQGSVNGESRSTLTLNISNNAVDEADMIIHNFVVALFSNDTRIIYQGATGNTTKVTDLIAGFNVDIYVVANATNSDFENITTKDGFESKVASLSQETSKLIKVGVKENYTLQKGDNNSIEIEVSQVAARVDLAGIRVLFEGGNSNFTFDLTDVELKNAQKTTKLATKSYNDNNAATDIQAQLKDNNFSGITGIAYGDRWYGKENSASTASPIETLYTFANPNVNTQLVIKGKIMRGTTLVQNCEWTVDLSEDNYLKRGHLYEVFATIKTTVTNPVSPTISYKVATWNQATINIPTFE